MRSSFPRLHARFGLLAVAFAATLACAQNAPAPRSPAQQNASSTHDAQGATPLTAAAAQGDAKAVQSLIAAGASLDATDSQGRTALIVAAEGRQAEVAKALVAAGADLNREARYIGSALNVAENNGDTELAAWLLAAGAHSTGKSVGDTVCIRSWGGEGFCGTVKSFTVRSLQLVVTRLVGCAQGCAARQECSAAKPVGGVNGLHDGEQIAVPSWCLTDTAVKQ